MCTLDVFAERLTPSSTTTISQAEPTPRVVTVTQRTVPPEVSSEPRDFHAALARMLKPRKTTLSWDRNFE